MTLSGIGAALWRSMTWLTAQLLFSVHHEPLLLSITCSPEEVPRGNFVDVSLPPVITALVRYLKKWFTVPHTF